MLGPTDPGPASGARSWRDARSAGILRAAYALATRVRAGRLLRRPPSAAADLTRLFGLPYGHMDLLAVRLDVFEEPFQISCSETEH
jgi:hypothetical protein